MKALAIGLPVDTAFDIADGKRTAFMVKERPPRKGRIIIFSREGGNSDRPGLATVADANLATWKWTGRGYYCRLTDIVPLVPHLPILMSETITEQDIPDALVEPYPNKRNIKRWLKC